MVKVHQDCVPSTMLTNYFLQVLGLSSPDIEIDGFYADSSRAYFTSNSQGFNKSVNIYTVTKEWVEVYPLYFRYFGNEYCDIGFEIVVFNVGWKDAEFIEDQVPNLSLEDKADFLDGRTVKCPKMFMGPIILDLGPRVPRPWNNLD